MMRTVHKLERQCCVGEAPVVLSHIMCPSPPPLYITCIIVRLSWLITLWPLTITVIPSSYRYNLPIFYNIQPVAAMDGYPLKTRGKKKKAYHLVDASIAYVMV